MDQLIRMHRSYHVSCENLVEGPDTRVVGMHTSKAVRTTDTKAGGIAG